MRDDQDLEEAFEKMISQLTIHTNVYAISTCCNNFNEILEGYAVGGDIGLYHAENNRKLQLFFSNPTLRLGNPGKLCAKKLRKACEEFDFLLENSYCDANDAEYCQSRPKSWEFFFNTLFNCSYSTQVR